MFEGEGCNLNQTILIEEAEKFAKSMMENDSTGHDWFHVDRVRKTALYIANKEQKGNLFIIEMAALLHDVTDDKLNENVQQGQMRLQDFFERINLEHEATLNILEVIHTISFRGGEKKKLTTWEAKIVQDADRLDAIGAIGIARAFAYGGKKGNPIYHPAYGIRENMTVEEYRNGQSSSIHHFYEKLLLLKDLLNTETAKVIAEDRHRFMEQYLTQFYLEWNGLV
jgi:uncharacterized protein